MSSINNNLYAFTISKDRSKFYKDLICMWHILDNDYSEEGLAEGNTQLTFTNRGYTSRAEEKINEVNCEYMDDKAFIRLVLMWIKNGHGSYSSQFLHQIVECGSIYVVAVSFLN